MTKKQNPYQSGQIGVIIVLIMSVLLTVGLSMSANTNSDLFVSQQEEESNRVFNAAEVGIEQALSSNLAFEGESSTGTVDNITDVGVDYSISKTRTLETRLFEGVSVKVDVSNANDGDTLRIDWSRENDCVSEDPASILISIYHDEAGTLTVRNYAYAACARADGFTSVANINENSLRRRIDLAMQAGDQFVRIKPVYNDTHVRVYSSSVAWTLPVQGFLIRSSANNELGNETRVVEVNRTLPTAPSVMDYSLYSGGTISK